MGTSGEKQLGETPTVLDRVETAEEPVLYEKELAQQAGRDYAGATAKTDPKEINLVKKLDFRIMVNMAFLMMCFSFSTTSYILQVAARIAVLYAAQILATGVSGLIAAGVFYGLDDVRGISGWRWLFIIEGCVTAVVAFAGFWLLPNTPSTTRWLKPEERELAHARIEMDKMGEPEQASAMEGLRQACRDKRTWIFCLMQNFHLSACGFNSFFPTSGSVVKTIGFNTTITLLLTCPPFIFAGIVGILFGYSSGRFHERTWHITVGLTTAIVGFVIAACTLNTAGRYIACFIFPIGAYSVNSVIIGWASSTLSQTREKRAVILAMTNIGGQIGYIYGAYVWPDYDSPRYVIGFSIIIVECQSAAEMDLSDVYPVMQVGDV
ncbi:MFS transporter [Coccidioides immitis RMSCC 3703]|uniref:MFS transporter n=1 Tax=Coccidioides immitis RMSCC 3703 TaxID=454286 RepID=A0A0J8R6Y0_COCIT|nr:MFS transporter [Coccidioides immitis RMSCC 3703]